MTLLESLITDLNRATPARLTELGRTLALFKSDAETRAEYEVLLGMDVLRWQWGERRKVLEETT